MTSQNGPETSDSVNLGSNPSPPATTNTDKTGVSGDLASPEIPAQAEQTAHTGRTKAGTALTDLISRLQKATGPDPQIDYAIGEWLFMQGRQPWECFNYGKDGPAIKFTSSIDAAFTLMPQPTVLGDKGRTLKLVFAEHNSFASAEVNYDHLGYGKTPAIALCVAALKARSVT